MDALLLVGRLLLAGVFAVAGTAKLADREGSRKAIIGFGLPAHVSAPLGILLPLFELTVAAILIPTYTALWGAVGALGLLLVFVLGISLNLVRGRKPDCHCFGQLHSAPAGWKTLARNGALAAVAGFLVWQGWNGYASPSTVGWLGTLSTGQLLGLIFGALLLGLMAAQGWFLVHLLRQNGRLLVRLESLEENLFGGTPPSGNGAAARLVEGLPVGARAPAFDLPGLYGETHTLESLRASGKPVLLLFTDPNCGPCTAMLPEIGRWQREHAEKLSVALISRGTAEENRAKSTEHGLSGVLLQEEWEVLEAYEVHGTPSAVFIRPDGVVGSPVVAGAEEIRDLVTRAVETPSRVPLLPGAPAAEANGNGGPCPNCGKRHPAEGAPAMPVTLAVGEPAPEVKLQDLSGKDMSLADFRGEETLVLFWNPGCGFCQQMLPDLKEWEANSFEGAPKLLVVSAGMEEANREMELDSPVLLDEDFSVGRSFGAGGTPSAVLVDAEGRIASEVAVGAPKVLELAGAGQR